MTRYAIITDLNRCVGCLACSAACKLVNGVLPGNFWNKTIRVGPNLKEGGSGHWPDVEMYFLTLQCQHCENPECVKVCPTGASVKREDGTVQIDKEKCIGCQFCVMACPYGTRYLNKDEGVVEKCTLCEQKIVEGQLPQCVQSCSARARFFGDLDKGYDSFEANYTVDITKGDPSYEKTINSRITLKECVPAYTKDDIHHLPDTGNGPQIAYILRNRKWQGGE
jgi:Fe-S-cluster-containing dehydrogenase component